MEIRPGKPIYTLKTQSCWQVSRITQHLKGWQLGVSCYPGGKICLERLRRLTLCHNESEALGEGVQSMCTALHSHDIWCVRNKFDLPFHDSSKTSSLKGSLYPFSKSDSPSNGISLKKKCNEMWLVQMSVKFIVLLKSYWVFVYEMYFSVFEV